MKEFFGVALVSHPQSAPQEFLDENDFALRQTILPT